ncbi:MAG: MinD/ParA family protein [Thermodesulfobacterium sp.]|jgi:flagellar biosynthesis protein FlhG|nr:MinD/ParA family protein [Thermodesulfobacterium sp.]
MLSIAVSSGKGGVGKTSFVINLACLLAELNKKVIIFDADLGLANVDIMLGLTPKFDVRYVLSGDLTLKDIIYHTEYKFDLIPAGSGVSELTQLSPAQKVQLKSQLEEALKPYDILLFDLSAGISDNVLFFNQLAEERILICTTEPTSLADAYAILKVSYQKLRLSNFNLVVNMIKSDEEAKQIYRRLLYVVERFLPELSLNYLGAIPYDECVKRAIKSQIPFTKLCPDSIVSKKLREIVFKVLQFKGKKDSLAQFLDRFVSNF